MPSLRSAIYYRLARFNLKRMRQRNLPLPELRTERDKVARRNFKVPDGVAVQTESALSIPAEWLVPAGVDAKGPAVLYLHGGAYVTGSLDTHRALAARIAMAARLPMLIIDYRLAPENPFPAALDDAIEAYRFLARQGRRVGLAGDSAGGGLALALGVSLRESGDQSPFAFALMSPWTDLAMTGATIRTRAAVDPFFPTSEILETAAAHYVAKSDFDNPLISPLYASLDALPPMLIHVGEREALLDDSKRLASRARSAGVDATIKEWPAMWHVWQAFGGRFPEADRSIGELGAFLLSKTE